MDLVFQIGEILKQKKLILATAESCTGGQVAQMVTAVPGSSEWFERGFVTYSNQSKIEMLGVAPVTLTQYGAVSAEVVREMAEGALRYSHAQVSLAITGIAGPGGGSPQKPVGTVWFAWARIGHITQVQSQIFKGDRVAVRDQAAIFALQKLWDNLGNI